MRTILKLFRATSRDCNKLHDPASNRSKTPRPDEASITLRSFRHTASVCALAVFMTGLMSAHDANSRNRADDFDPDIESASTFKGRISRAAVVAKKSQVVEIGRAYASALVAEAEIADVVPLSDHSVYILGKKIGATRITVVGADQKIIQIIEVEVTPDVDNLRAKLKENLPEAHIRVSTINGGIVLSGTVFDAPAVEQAMAIARRYSPDAVTNAMSVAGPQQVMLEVRFVEASRSASREIGISTRVRGPSASSDTNGQVFDAGIGALQTAALMSGAVPFGTLLARVLEGGTNVDLMLRALEERDLARRLAEPNLVTTSGDTASFLAGGEFPFPVSASDNRISIEFKQFGVALAFTPTVLNGGLINLKIAPEVSDIDESTTVEVNNVRIPGLIVRRANTTVELKDGQSLGYPRPTLAALQADPKKNGHRLVPVSFSASAGDVDYRAGDVRCLAGGEPQDRLRDFRSLTAAGRKVGATIDTMAPALPVAVVGVTPVVPVATTTTTTTESTTDAADGTATPTPVPPVAAAPSLYQVPLNLTVSGSYFELEQFVNKLEGLKRSFRVTGFTVGASSGETTTSGDLSINLQGQVFMAPPPSAVPAPLTPVASAPAAQ